MGIAHSVRVRSYWPGGKDSCPVDRAVGGRVTGMHPGTVSCARRRAEESAPEVAQFGAVARKP